jgi:pimeloyl-ACP methyl ester carboxylesterase
MAIPDKERTMLPVRLGGSNVLWRGLAAACTLAAILAVMVCHPGASFAAEPQEKIGVVLLHGKMGRPEQHMGALIGPLKREHCLVESPEMPWSFRRYLTADYDTALKEIDKAVEKLKSKGATRIIIAGHSMGANAALAYAVSRGGVAGIILLAPGHFPERRPERFAADVAAARERISAGRGDKSLCFRDVNQGQEIRQCTKASIYYSYFDPDGLGSMPKSASRLSPQIPLLCVVGKHEPYAEGREYIFDKAPPHPLSRYVEVDAGHLDTPSVAVPEVISWLHSLDGSGL